MSLATAEDQVSRTAVAAFASLAPLYALLSFKTRLRLDNVHLVLAQLLVLTILRFAVNLTPKRVASAAVAIEAKVAPGSVTTQSASNAEAKKPKRKVKKRKAAAKGENAKYSYATMDASLYRFLSVSDPAQLEKLGDLPPGSRKPPERLALTDWTETFRDDALVVLKHPNAQAMFAICYKFKDIEMRKLWEILVDIKRRPSWDGLCEKSEDLDALGQKNATTRPKQRVGSVSWMAMKGMFPVKAKDLVLMSVVAQLPASPSTIPSTPDKDVLRLVCATTSVEHDSKPAGQGGYQRMELDISGFILEEDGEGGVLLTQITDLSGLGTWVPAKIINLVTQTMIPKSLAKIGKRAASLELEGPRADLKGDDWLPPVLGGWRDLPDNEAGAAAEGDAAEEGEVEEDEEDEEDDDVAAGGSLTTLVAQLRTLTARLSALEAQKSGNAGSNTGGYGSYLWNRLFGSKPNTQAAATDGSGLSLLDSGIVALLGGAASAFTILSVATAWAKRRA